ncbi:MAG TPA: hypothetical protein PKN95_09190 [Verrucomicrobiota bacterium]|nr:hypothetical protein [Verrucomicrobiota bacterium]HNT14085.1 hypothetical protein [Verrucomicrobiota bacterium]
MSTHAFFQPGRGTANRLWIARLLLCGWMAAPWSGAQTAAEFPELRPIRTTIPTTFWERHGRTLTVYSLELLALGILGAGLLSRTPPRAPEPIAVVTRRRLEQLAAQPETRETISALARCLRGYYQAAFGGPAGELTTEEFCRALMTNPEVGAALAARVVRLMQDCDARRFASGNYVSARQLWQQADALFQAGEARRRELRSVPAEQLAFRVT